MLGETKPAWPGHDQGLDITQKVINSVPWVNNGAVCDSALCCRLAVHPEKPVKRRRAYVWPPRHFEFDILLSELVGRGSLQYPSRFRL
jgi:hypothetical protein